MQVGLVAGRILDPLGQPLPDCNVALVAMTKVRAFEPDAVTAPLGEATSGADGRFELRFTSACEGIVTVRHRDFPPRVAAYGIEIELGATHEVGDVTLFSQPGLIVLVRTTSGVGVGDAVVIATPALQDVSLPTAIHGLAERSAITDPSGQGVLYGVAPGSYVVRVEASFYATQERNHLQAENPTKAPSLEFVVDVGHVIRGRVQTQAGADPGRVLITAEPVDGGVVLRDEVRATGDFRITGAVLGRYRIWADSTRLDRSMVETVVPNSGVVVIPLGSGLSLRGVVRDDATGNPVPGAVVVAEPEDGWPLIRAGRTVRLEGISGQDGLFTIIGLPPGRFAVTVSSQWFVPTRLGPVAAGIEPIEIRLEPGLSVTGVLRQSGRPVVNAKVRAIAWEAESAAFALWRSNLTDAAAHRTVSDETGTFVLSGVEVQGRRLVIDANGCALWFSEPLRGRKGESLDLGSIEMSPGAVIEGTAVAHATVYLQSTDARGLAHTTAADGKGRFVFESLPAGEYELFYHSAGRVAAGASATSPPTDSKTAVTLRSGDRKAVSLTN